MKLGELNASLMCQHNSLVMTVNAALGGKTEGAADNVRNLTDGHATPEAAVAAINAAMSF